MARYRPMMEAFLVERFPYVCVDDVIQETLLALAKAIPGYRYDPDASGHFRSYLTGILAHKAVDICRKHSRHEALKEEWGKRLEQARTAVPLKDDLRKVILEIAMRQLMLDDTIRQKTKLVFHKVAVEGVAPDKVAEMYGVTRNAVDQIKDRMVRKLRTVVEALEVRNGD